MLSNTPPLSGKDEFRLLVEQAPYMLARHSADFRFVYASPASDKLTGYVPADILGKPLGEFIHTADQEKVRKVLVSARNNSEVHVVEYRFRHHNGGYIWLESVFTSSKDEDSSHIFSFSRDITSTKRLEDGLQIIARGRASLSRDDFFRPLVCNAATALQVSFAFVTFTNPEKTKVRMLAFWKGDHFAEPYEYPLAETPCDSVINDSKTCFYPVGIQALFPKDMDLVALNAQGYLGIPIYDSHERVIGHLAVLDNKPLKLADLQMWFLKIFAMRAGIEMERMLHETESAAD